MMSEMCFKMAQKKVCVRVCIHESEGWKDEERSAKCWNNCQAWLTGKRGLSIICSLLLSVFEIFHENVLFPFYQICIDLTTQQH